LSLLLVLPAFKVPAEMDLEKEFVPGTTAQGLVRLPAAEACCRGHAVPTLPCPASAARVQGGSGWEDTGPDSAFKEVMQWTEQRRRSFALLVVCVRRSPKFMHVT